MPHRPIADAAAKLRIPSPALATCLLAGCLLAGCGVLPGVARPLPARPAPVIPAPAPAPAPAAAPAPLAPADLAGPADNAARRLLAFYEELIRMGPAELAAQIARLDAQVARAEAAAGADAALALALALAQQHNAGDLARAASLLDPIASGANPELRPWQGLARLLAGRVAEQRRLEDQIERQGAQRRDTQRTIQQLSEKLEAPKAIERSMITRSAGGPASNGAAAPGAEQAPSRTP